MILKVKDYPHVAAQANIFNPPAAILHPDNQSGRITDQPTPPLSTQSAWEMELTFEDVPNKHLVSDPTTDVGQASQGDGGRLAVDLALAVVPARQQPKPALCLWRGENNGMHHKSLPAQQTERAGFYPPFIRPGGNRLAWDVWKQINKQPVFSLFGVIQAWWTCSIKIVSCKHKPWVTFNLSVGKMMCSTLFPGAIPPPIMLWALVCSNKNVCAYMCALMCVCMLSLYCWRISERLLASVR